MCEAQLSSSADRPAQLAWFGCNDELARIFPPMAHANSALYIYLFSVGAIKDVNGACLDLKKDSTVAAFGWLYWKFLVQLLRYSPASINASFVEALSMPVLANDRNYEQEKHQ